MDKNVYFVYSDNIPPLLSSFMQGVEQAEQMIRFASKESNLSLSLSETIVAETNWFRIYWVNK